MKLRIWWNSNFGHKEFSYNVDYIQQARIFLDLLAKYDLYLDDKIVANVQGLQIYNEETKEWDEWYCEEEDEDINSCTCTNI